MSEGGGTLVTPDLMIGGGYNDWYWKREGSTIDGASLSVETEALGLDREGVCLFCLDVDPFGELSVLLEFDTGGHLVTQEEVSHTISVLSNCMQDCIFTGTGTVTAGTGTDCCPGEPPEEASCVNCFSVYKYKLEWDADGHLKRILNPCDTVKWDRELTDNDGVRIFAFKIVVREDPIDTGTGTGSCLTPPCNPQYHDVFSLDMLYDANGHLISVTKSLYLTELIYDDCCCKFGGVTVRLDIENETLGAMGGFCECTPIEVVAGLVSRIHPPLGECIWKYRYEWTGFQPLFCYDENGGEMFWLAFKFIEINCFGPAAGYEITIHVTFDISDSTGTTQWFYDSFAGDECCDEGQIGAFNQYDLGINGPLPCTGDVILTLMAE